MVIGAHIFLIESRLEILDALPLATLLRGEIKLEDHILPRWLPYLRIMAQFAQLNNPTSTFAGLNSIRISSLASCLPELSSPMIRCTSRGFMVTSLKLIINDNQVVRADNKFYITATPTNDQSLQPPFPEALEHHVSLIHS